MHSFWKRILKLTLIFTILTALGGCWLGKGNLLSQTTENATAVPMWIQSEKRDKIFRDSLLNQPARWNPHTWSSPEDRMILDQTSMGLYSVLPDQTARGWKFQPEMAASAPKDVTGQYAGTRGVPVSASDGYAFQIDLKQNAFWQDGTRINADTYLYSMEQLLSSDRKNPWAARFTTGQMVIANAWPFYMQDQAGEAVFIPLAELGYSSVLEAVNDGQKDFYLNMQDFWGLSSGWQPLESQVPFRDKEVAHGNYEAYVTAKYLYETYLADAAPYETYQTQFVGIFKGRIPKLSFDHVGFLKTGEYQITIVLEKPLTVSQLQANLLTGFLVHPALYETWGEAYGTALNRYSSCGPYRIESIAPDQILLQRNSNWYGYGPEASGHEFQPDGVRYTIYESQQAAEEAFRQGQLDTVVLSEPCENAWQVPQTFVSKLTFNTSLPALQSRQAPGINKTILANPDFRRGISLAIDRQAFVQACVPTAVPALGLLGNAFLWDLETGESYRESPLGKQVMTRLYGSEMPSGYQPELARKLLQQAYEEALQQHIIHPDEVVELEFLVFGTDNVYQEITDFLQKAISEAAVGTDLENRIRIVKTVEPHYYEAARNGNFEIILSTWGGNAWDPYEVMSCYCDADKRFEFGFDPGGEQLPVQVGSRDVSMTYRWWYEEMVNGEYSDAPAEIRCEILAELEYHLLSSCNCVPLYERSIAVADGSAVQRQLSAPVPMGGLCGLRYVKMAENNPILP